MGAKQRNEIITGMRAAAPLLQLPWEEPTDDEGHAFCAELEKFIVRTHWASIMWCLRQFVRRRNEALQPKPTLSKKESVEKLLNDYDAHRLDFAVVKAKILAVLAALDDDSKEAKK